MIEFFTIERAYFDKVIVDKIRVIVEGPRSGDPREINERAEQQLRRCLELRPDGKIRDDAKDLLSSLIKEDVE